MDDEKDAFLDDILGCGRLPRVEVNAMTVHYSVVWAPLNVSHYVAVVFVCVLRRRITPTG